jgi:hypothetical protein
MRSGTLTVQFHASCWFFSHEALKPPFDLAACPTSIQSCHDDPALRLWRGLPCYACKQALRKLKEIH